MLVPLLNSHSLRQRSTQHTAPAAHCHSPVSQYSPSFWLFLTHRHSSPEHPHTRPVSQVRPASSLHACPSFAGATFAKQTPVEGTMTFARAFLTQTSLAPQSCAEVQPLRHCPLSHTNPLELSQSTCWAQTSPSNLLPRALQEAPVRLRVLITQTSVVAQPLPFCRSQALAQVPCEPETSQNRSLEPSHAAAPGVMTQVSPRPRGPVFFVGSS